MNIKTKLFLGFGFMLVLSLILLIISTTNIYWLTNDTNNILENNQKSLQYVHHMLAALDKQQWSKLEENLKLQQNNITEVGEEEATQQFAATFQQFKLNPQDSKQASYLRELLVEIMQLNLSAIMRKGQVASQSAKQATFWIVFSSTLCLLASLILVTNLPAHIANPIRALNHSIAQIAARNYSQRLRFDRNDEFEELANNFNKMAAKLEEYQNSNLSKIIFEKTRIEALINNIEDPIIGFDENRLIMFANQEALEVLGIGKSELVGLQAEEVALYNDLMRLLTQDLLGRPASGATLASEPLKIYQNGKENYFEKHIEPIYAQTNDHENENLIGYLFMLHNITTYKELDVAKTNFIANVSHELKTPIAAIQMGVKLLKDKKIGTLNDEQHQLIDNIGDDCKRLLLITTELLGISQVEAGKIILNLTQTHPKTLINNALQATQASANEKNIEVVLEIEENIDHLTVDVEKTTWVINNLISNGIRYSHENAKIIIRCLSHSAHIIFEVQDFGKGIDKQYIHKVFDRYFRIPGNKSQGSGLGLAISKEFIEAQGGYIEVDSELGSGAIFRFFLPKK